MDQLDTTDNSTPTGMTTSNSIDSHYVIRTQVTKDGGLMNEMRSMLIQLRLSRSMYVEVLLKYKLH